MKMLLGIAAAILAGHACAAGRSTLDEMPAPAGSIFLHAYLEDDDPDKYSEVFFAPAMIDGLPGAIVTLRLNNGKDVQQGLHRFFLPEKDERFCSAEGGEMRHAVGGKIVDEGPWKTAVPVDWDERQRPKRTYAGGTSPIDIIGTELCLAHFSTFGSDLEERSTALMAERKRRGDEQVAIREARYEADIAAFRTCIRDREALARASESAEREAGRLTSAESRLAGMRASLELQQGILDSYTPSAASTNAFNRQLQSYNVALAEHRRNVKAYERVVARDKTDIDRINAACSRQFDGAAVRKVCRDTPSEFCPDEKTLR